MGCPSFQEWPVKEIAIVSHIDTRLHLLHMRKPQSKERNLPGKKYRSKTHKRNWTNYLWIHKYHYLILYICHLKTSFKLWFWSVLYILYIIPNKLEKEREKNNTIIEGHQPMIMTNVLKYICWIYNTRINYQILLMP